MGHQFNVPLPWQYIGGSNSPAASDTHTHTHILEEHET